MEKDEAGIDSCSKKFNFQLLLRRWRWIPKVKDPTLPVAKSGQHIAERIGGVRGQQARSCRARVLAYCLGNTPFKAAYPLGTPQ